jgi:hypothetical protein
MGGIYEVCHWDELRGHDIYVHTMFHKDWFRHSKVDREGHTDTQQGNLISLLPFFQNKESRLKRANRSFQNVAKLKYLGMTVTNQNLINEEIKSRLDLGNACYH